MPENNKDTVERVTSKATEITCLVFLRDGSWQGASVPAAGSAALASWSGIQMGPRSGRGAAGAKLPQNSYPCMCNVCTCVIKFLMVVIRFL